MSEEEILIALKEIHARYCIPASEQNYTDKDYACMQYEKLVIHLQKEIERLNNIINELEKWLDEEYQYYDKYGSAPTGCAMGQINRTKDKLQELKGSDSNE